MHCTQSALEQGKVQEEHDMHQAALKRIEEQFQKAVEEDK